MVPLGTLIWRGEALLAVTHCLALWWVPSLTVWAMVPAVAVMALAVYTPGPARLGPPLRFSMWFYLLHLPVFDVLWRLTPGLGAVGMCAAGAVVAATEGVLALAVRSDPTSAGYAAPAG